MKLAINQQEQLKLFKGSVSYLKNAAWRFEDPSVLNKNVDIYKVIVYKLRILDFKNIRYF